MADVASVSVRETDVDYQGVGWGVIHPRECVVAGECDACREALFAKPSREEVAQLGVVFNDQHPRVAHCSRRMPPSGSRRTARDAATIASRAPPTAPPASSARNCQ